jgi:hypothetical protein
MWIWNGVAWVPAYTPDRRWKFDGASWVRVSPQQRLSARLVVLYAAVTAASYLAWLGWHLHQSFGSYADLHGEYPPSHIAGLVATLTVLSAIAGCRDRTLQASLVITAAMALTFALDAGSEPGGDGLWPIGAATVAMGTIIGTALVEAIAILARRLLRPALPVRTQRSA